MKTICRLSFSDYPNILSWEPPAGPLRWNTILWWLCCLPDGLAPKEDPGINDHLRILRRLELHQAPVLHHPVLHSYLEQQQELARSSTANFAASFNLLN